MIKATDERDLGAFIPSTLDDYGLDPFEFRVYSHIARRAGSGECWEAIDNIAACCKMNVKTARKAIALLSLAGLITQAPRQGKTNSIKLTHSRGWVKSSDLDLIREKLTPTKSGTPTRRYPTPTKSGTPPLPSGGTPPLPNQVPKGTPIKGIPEGTPIKEERKDFFFEDASLSEPEVATELPVLSSHATEPSAASNTGLETKSSAAANFSEKEKIELTHAQMIDLTSARFAYPECKWNEIYELYKMGLGHLWVGPDRLTDWHPALMAGATAHKVKVQQDSTPAAVQQYIRNLITKKLDADLEARFNEGVAIEDRKRQAEAMRTAAAPTESKPGYYNPYAPIDLEQARRGKAIALAAMARAKEGLQRAGA